MNIYLETALKFITKISFFPKEDAIKYAETAHDSDLTILVLSRADISEKEALLLTKKFNDVAVTKTVLEREDVSEYLASIEPCQALYLAKEVDMDEVWRIVLERPDVMVYLRNLGQEQALSLSKKLDYPEVYSIILNRSDIVSWLESNLYFGYDFGSVLQSKQESGLGNCYKAQIELYQTATQGDNIVASYSGYNLRREINLSSARILNGDALEWLLRAPKYIPVSWRNYRAYFVGTLYVDNSGKECWRYLQWDTAREAWGWFYTRLENDFSGFHNRIAVYL